MTVECEIPNRSPTASADISMFTYRNTVLSISDVGKRGPPPPLAPGLRKGILSCVKRCLTVVGETCASLDTCRSEKPSRYRRVVSSHDGSSRRKFPPDLHPDLAEVVLAGPVATDTGAVPPEPVVPPILLAQMGVTSADEGHRDLGVVFDLRTNEHAHHVDLRVIPDRKLFGFELPGATELLRASRSCPQDRRPTPGIGKMLGSLELRLDVGPVRLDVEIREPV